MESVIKKIRQSREDDNKKQVYATITETVVDGCSVKIRFAAHGESNIMSVIRSMLVSAHMDNALRGETSL